MGSKAVYAGRSGEQGVGGHRTGCSVHPEWTKEGFREGSCLPELDFEE